MHTIKDYLVKYSKKIPLLDLEILIALVIKKKRVFVMAYPEYILSRFQEKKLNQYIKQRMFNVPVAYILGKKEFYGLEFLVNKNVLIPRPETELMVDEAIKFITNFSQPAVLIDIGTGSGCVPISIIKTIEHKNIKTREHKNIHPVKSRQAGIPTESGLFNRVKILATDISMNALRVAKSNSKKHEVNITFLHGNLLEPIIKNIKRLKYYNISEQSERNIPISKIVITANLPYLTQKEANKEASISREPKKALVADNKQGLSLYEQLLKQIKIMTKDLMYDQLEILLEINPFQTQKISTFIKKNLPFSKVEILKDLSGKNRLVKINW